MAYETDTWPFVRAKYFRDVPPGRKVRLVVIHCMEAPEKGETAENVAAYFARGDVVASAHICVDADSIVQCVKDSDVAYAAPGANADGIQIELAGYARQSQVEWLDEYSIRMLNRAAYATAQYCVKYNLPPAMISSTELRQGARGIVSHWQVTQVYKQSDHTDPGPNFPWTIFLALVQVYFVPMKRDRWRRA